MTWELVITGCGTSHGNPPWGWPDLWSSDPRDARRRSGAMLFGPDGQVLLLDASPDLMHQLRDPRRTWDGVGYPSQCVTRCDGLLLTHIHADHCHGVNDLRHLNRLMGGASIPVYAHPDHLDGLMSMFAYCFGGRDEVYHLGSPALMPTPLADGQPSTIAGLEIEMVAMGHGPAGRTSGFRCGSLAYLTDFKTLPPASRARLRGLGLLVLDMLREELHSTHLCWSEAQEVIADLQPERTVLTHMGHEVRYAEWQRRLPPQVEMAYDGWHATFEARARRGGAHA
jgi:phosphoribosyl 1,2-cyclic phosphate phosphodiesterase